MFNLMWMSEDLPVDSDILPPRADALIHSLRAFGYDLPTAIADLLDNSIAAGATAIDLECYWNGEKSYIAIIDNGVGMSESVILEAMRLGSRSPLEKRKKDDLGRFGLGLKTASFSQCLSLTVASKTKNSNQVIRKWDLPFVTKRNEWILLRHGTDCLNSYSARLEEMQSGTVVLWEALDRLTQGTQTNDDRAHRVFLDRIEGVRSHLSMVFHRFLEPPKPLRITLNGTAIEPWDPFMLRDPATQQLNEEAIPFFGDSISVKPYVLPHISKLSPSAYERGAGIWGWNQHQGFYVYRSRRLLSAGQWLGLGFRNEEHCRLARIQLDIPNSMDAEWEIDVKKARATPPASLRPRLKQLAVIVRDRASEVYRSRGARITTGPIQTVTLWEPKVRHGKTFYAINRGHPLVQSLDSLDPSHRKTLDALLMLVEESLPVPTIIYDVSSKPEGSHTTPFEGDDKKIVEVIKTMYSVFRSRGLSPGDSKAPTDDHRDNSAV